MIKKFIQLFKSLNLTNRLSIICCIMLVVYSLFWIFCQNAKNPLLLLLVDIIYIKAIFYDISRNVN